MVFGPTLPTPPAPPAFSGFEAPVVRLVALVALGALVLLVIGGFLALRWDTGRRRRAAQARAARAFEGEARAEGLLLAEGYTVVGRQVRATYAICVNGEPLPVDLRADYVVALGERRFVAEVKTGRLAPTLRTAATRRQLLEYHVGFGADGLLLVDAESGAIHRVEFPVGALTPARPSAWPAAATTLGWILAVAALALAYAWIKASTPGPS